MNITEIVVWFGIGAIIQAFPIYLVVAKKSRNGWARSLLYLNVLVTGAICFASIIITSGIVALIAMTLLAIWLTYSMVYPVPYHAKSRQVEFTKLGEEWDLSSRAKRMVKVAFFISLGTFATLVTIRLMLGFDCRRDIKASQVTYINIFYFIIAAYLLARYLFPDATKKIQAYFLLSAVISLVLVTISQLIKASPEGAVLFGQLSDPNNWESDTGALFASIILDPVVQLFAVLIVFGGLLKILDNFAAWILGNIIMFFFPFSLWILVLVNVITPPESFINAFLNLFNVISVSDAFKVYGSTGGLLVMSFSYLFWVVSSGLVLLIMITMVSLFTRLPKALTL